MTNCVAFFVILSVATIGASNCRAEIEFPEKKKAIYGLEFTGGDSYEQAPAAPLDTEFRIGHHQDVDYYDYYYLDLKQGQALKLTAKTGSKGLRDKRVSSSCRATVHLHSAERVRLRTVLSKQCHSKKEAEFIAPADGRYYLLVGDDRKQLHKDFAYFLATVVDTNDSGYDRDAGETTNTALEIQIDSSFRGSLSTEDTFDLYSFQGVGGETVALQVHSKDQPEVMLLATVKSEIGQVFETVRAKGSELARGPEFKLPISGVYYLEVKCASASRSDDAIVSASKRCLGSGSTGAVRKSYSITIKRTIRALGGEEDFDFRD